MRSQFSCWFKKDYRQGDCSLGTVIECNCAVWEAHCSLFTVIPPLHLFSSWGGTMTPECHQRTLGLPSPGCQSAGMANSHPHGAPSASHCSSVVNHCFICHVQLQRAGLESLQSEFGIRGALPRRCVVVGAPALIKHILTAHYCIPGIAFLHVS